MIKGNETMPAARARMLALIATFTNESALVREIAARIVMQDDGCDESELEDDEDQDVVYFDALRRRFPEATDDEITRGHNLVVAVAKTVNPAVWQEGH